MTFSFQEWDWHCCTVTGHIFQAIWTAQQENTITVVRLNFLVNRF